MKLRATKIDRLKLLGADVSFLRLDSLTRWKVYNRQIETCSGRMDRLKIRAFKIDRLKLLGVNIFLTRQTKTPECRKDSIFPWKDNGERIGEANTVQASD